MTQQAMEPEAGKTGARERLDFLFDASGWQSHGQSGWHFCAEGRIGGREMLAIAIRTRPQSPLPAGILTELAEWLRQQERRRLPLVLIPASVKMLDEPHLHAALGDFLASLSRYSSRAPMLVAALEPLVGPMAVISRLADMAWLSPSGEIALAAEQDRRQVQTDAELTSYDGWLDCRFSSDAAALLGLRLILGLLPAGGEWHRSGPIRAAGEDAAFERLIGADADAPIDARRLVQLLTDDRSFVELGRQDSLIVALARIGGNTAGVLASNSAVMSGALDAGVLARAERLVRFCSRNGIPLVTLVDAPGVLPNDAALAGLASLAAAWDQADVPVVSLIVRRAVGAAALALVPPPRSDARAVLHWPEAHAGLLRQSAVKPGGQAITVRKTRMRLVEALASLRSSST